MRRKSTKARAARKPTKPTKKKERSSNLRIFDCAICKEPSRGVGNDAWPTVPGGICCDKCHEEYGAVVLPLEECLECWGMGWANKILAGGA
jgi:hypothetical protein